MLARHHLERDERGASTGRALVLEPPAQELGLLREAKRPDRAVGGGADAVVVAPDGVLELVGDVMAQVGESALVLELRRSRCRLREVHLRPPPAALSCFGRWR